MAPKDVARQKKTATLQTLIFLARFTAKAMTTVEVPPTSPPQPPQTLTSLLSIPTPRKRKTRDEDFADALPESKRRNDIKSSSLSSPSSSSPTWHVVRNQTDLVAIGATFPGSYEGIYCLVLSFLKQHAHTSFEKREIFNALESEDRAQFASLQIFKNATRHWSQAGFYYPPASSPSSSSSSSSFPPEHILMDRSSVTLRFRYSGASSEDNWNSIPPHERWYVLKKAKLLGATYGSHYYRILTFLAAQGPRKPFTCQSMYGFMHSNYTDADLLKSITNNWRSIPSNFYYPLSENDYPRDHVLFQAAADGTIYFRYSGASPGAAAEAIRFLARPLVVEGASQPSLSSSSSSCSSSSLASSSSATASSSSLSSLQVLAAFSASEFLSSSSTTLPPPTIPLPLPSLASGGEPAPEQKTEQKAEQKQQAGDVNDDDDDKAYWLDLTPEIVRRLTGHSVTEQMMQHSMNSLANAFKTSDAKMDSFLRSRVHSFVWGPKGKRAFVARNEIRATVDFVDLFLPKADKLFVIIVLSCFRFLLNFMLTGEVADIVMSRSSFPDDDDTFFHIETSRYVIDNRKKQKCVEFLRQVSGCR